MAHQSDALYRLKTVRHKVLSLSYDLSFPDYSSVILLQFPFGRTDSDGEKSHIEYRHIASLLENLNKESTVCILTTPADAARFLPYIQTILKYQFWISIKLTNTRSRNDFNKLSAQHAALLVLTPYPGALRHTVTRIGYTYCPACKKTTKDYGGKKHTYNSYGTLMSDVWRDIEWNPTQEATVIIDRLQDVFGLEPYKCINIYDMQQCAELLPKGLTPKKLRQTEESPVHLMSKLINDDCIAALKGIPDNSVDFCFADPPYNLKKRYDSWDDNLEVQKYFEWCDRWLSEMARILKPSRTLAVINIPLWAVRHYQHLCKFLNFQSWIVWDSLSLPVRKIMPSHYAIICFSKGEPRPLFSPEKSEFPMKEFYCTRANCLRMRHINSINDRGPFNDIWYDIYRLKHNSRRVDHPCQLPPLLMRRLYALYTQPNEIIVDCFNGAGTSTLVADQMKRRYIGIELSPEYHAIAQHRHQMIAKKQDPFAKNSEIPKVKNSRVERLAKTKYIISKKTLQLDVRRIALLLGHMPSKEEVKQLSKYKFEYFENYFVSWGEVCAAARHEGMSEEPQKMTQLDLLVQSK